MFIANNEMGSTWRNAGLAYCKGKICLGRVKKNGET